MIETCGRTCLKVVRQVASLPLEVIHVADCLQLWGMSPTCFWALVCQPAFGNIA